MQKKNMKMSFFAAVNLLPSSIFCLSLPLYFFKLSRACLCSSSFMFRSSSLLVMNFMRDSHVVSSSVTLFEMLLWVKLLQIEPLNPFKMERAQIALIYIVNEHIFSIIELLPPKKILFACKQKSKRQAKGFSNFKRKEGNEFKCFRVKLFKKETLSSLRKF